MTSSARILITFHYRKRQTLQCFEVWSVLGDTEVVSYPVPAFPPRQGRWISVNWAQPWLLLQSSLQLTCRFISSKFFWWWGNGANARSKN